MEALSSFLSKTNITEAAASRYFTIQQQTDQKHITQWIQDQLKTADIVMFSKKECKFCQRANRLITGFTSVIDTKITFSVIELNTTDASIVQPQLKEMTQQTTVPNIFVSGKHVGGYDKFCAYFHRSLTRMCAEEEGHDNKENV